MRFDRLLLASASCALVAGTVSAQTTTTGSSGNASGQTSTVSEPKADTAQPGGVTGTPTNATGSGDMTGAQGNTTGSGGVTSTNAAFQKITPAPGADLLTVLKSSGQFTTLVKAITATNLTSVLQRPGSLTVFAPTDAAFAALPPGQLDTLMQPANAQQLQQFVLLHVVNTPIKSSELLGHSATNVATVATGKSVHLDGSSGEVKVDDASVLQADVKASNGTVFVIDKVLSPAYAPPAVATAKSTEAAATKTTKRKKH